MRNGFIQLTGRLLRTWLTLGAVLVLGPTAIVGAQTPDETMTAAMEKYEAAALPDAIGLFDKAILQLEPTRTDPKLRELLIKAYQYRARARVGVGEAAGAKVDLQTLLQLQPGFTMPDEVSDALRTLFTEVRQSVIGDRLITVVPENAQVEIDGQAVKDLKEPIALIAGKHVISVRRPGYASEVDRPFEVEPGSSLAITLSLARNAATVTLATNPVGVDVIVDGVSRGVTASSETTTDISAPKVISDLDVRAHRFEFVRDCYTSVTQTIDIDKFDDRTLPPVRLEHAIATVTVDTTTPGVVVFVDNFSRGPAPLTLPDVCEGKHIIEMRSPHGRYLQRLDLKTGDRERVSGELHPAFAFVSSSGGVEGLRGAGDVRADVEARLREVRGFTLYAPALDMAQAALKRWELTPDWLAFDKDGKAIAAAQKVTPALRTQLSTELARVFEAQGVAAVTVGSTVGAGQSDVTLSLLAAGSSEPDVIPVRLDDSDSLRRVIQTLDVTFPVFRPSLGVVPIDVHGPASTMSVIAADVTAAVKAAGLVPADRIVAVNGKKIDDVLALTSALQDLGRNASVTLDVMHNTTAKTVVVPLLEEPRAINLGDQSLLFNPLLVHLRHRLAFAANTPAEPVLRLNIAIALMRLGNWDGARVELERTKLPEGAGVAMGTVQYHLGNCYEKLGRFSDATQAWRKARDSAAWLTEDGPPVKELADVKLASGSNVR